MFNYNNTHPILLIDRNVETFLLLLPSKHFDTRGRGKPGEAYEHRLYFLHIKKSWTQNTSLWHAKVQKTFKKYYVFSTYIKLRLFPGGRDHSFTLTTI